MNVGSHGTMRVKLVRPNLADIRSSDAMPPLSLGILAALTPRDVEVSLVDEKLEPIDFDEPADLVAITAETFTAKNAYQIAMEYRRRGVQVVMGGWHPTFMAEEARQYCDAVVVGEAEGLWEQLIADARAKELRPIYRRDDRPDLKGIAPDRSIFRGKRYLPLSLVEFGRGCRYACDFCSIHAFHGSTPRQRPVREVVDEIESLGHQHVVFVDDNLLANQADAAELLRALIPLKIRWSCQISMDVCQHPEFLKLMAQSGCQLAMVGMESLDQRNLEQMNKQWSAGDIDYAKGIRTLQEHGIMVWGSFVLGYDHDTPESFDATAEFAMRNKLFLANFNPLVPMPGTDLYQRIQSEGRLLYDRWWLAPGSAWGQAVFRPRNMTSDQFTEGIFRARRMFNSYGSIFRRALDWKTHWRNPRNFGAFVLGNAIMRREIYRKHGLVLGRHGGAGVEEPLDEPLPV